MSDPKHLSAENSLNLEDLEIEQLVVAELNEETEAHPENLASCYFNCTEASAIVLE